MDNAPLTQTQIAHKLRDENLDEWLDLWWATQGVGKRGYLELMAAILPFATGTTFQCWICAAVRAMLAGRFNLGSLKRAWIALIAAYFS